MTSNNKQTALNEVDNKVVPVKYVMTLNEMIEKVKNEPLPEFIYSGIKENSVGIVFGPSKSGKTIFCENLGMAIAAQRRDYLGLPLKIKNPKVLIISFEEDCLHRTFRNIMQVERLIPSCGRDWANNYMVVSEDIPRYIITDDDWNLLKNNILEYAPGIVILDSITRMCQGIEDSKIAQEFMKNLRNLAKITATTILAIHHTTKMCGQPLSVSNIAGSRVIGQELDFAIGINKTLDGIRYVKDVFFRYAPDDKETVTTFSIDDHCWLNVNGEEYERTLLAEPDGRRNDANGNKIINFLTAKAETEVKHATWRELETHFVPTEFSRGTLNNQLKALIKKNRIAKTEDQYKIAS